MIWDMFGFSGRLYIRIIVFSYWLYFSNYLGCFVNIRIIWS